MSATCRARLLLLFAAVSAGSLPGCASGGAGGCEPGRRDLRLSAVATAMPGVGGGLRFGQAFAHGPRWSGSAEAEAVLQALDGTFGGTTDDAHFAQGLVGVRATRHTGGRVAPYARGGFATFKATGTNDLLDTATTYHGAYLGLGADLAVSPRVTTGPDLTVLFGLKEGNDRDHVTVLPQLGWHLTFWL